MAVTLKLALVLLILFSVKKPSLLGSSSICYSFKYEEITDKAETSISSSLWQYKQEHGINIRASSALKILLILAGDIELCPGPSTHSQKYATCDCEIHALTRRI